MNIDEIVQRLVQKKPDKIILFGSYADGTNREDSDLDLLVITDDDYMPQNYEQNMAVYLQYARQIADYRKQFSIDLLVYTKPMFQKFLDINSLFARNIMKNCKVLYENNNKRMA